MAESGVKVIRTLLTAAGQDLSPSSPEKPGIAVVSVYDKKSGRLIAESIEVHHEHRHGA